MVPHAEGNIFFNQGLFHDGENILESRAYLSNQPNISNKIGNGANNLNAAELTPANILEESNEGITQKDFAQNYGSRGSRRAGSTEPENFDESEVVRQKHRERVTLQDAVQAKRDLVVLEDPFQDRDIGDMDEYENINDEMSNEGNEESQTDTANIQSKYRTVNIDNYKSAGSVRSRSPNYQCQMDNKFEPPHQQQRNSYQNHMRNFKPPKSPVSITSLGSKGKETGQAPPQNTIQAGKLKLNLDRVLGDN
jgi:hypothetical protein